MSKKKYKKRPAKGTKAYEAWRKKVDRQNKLREWSLKVRDRDGNRCAACGSHEQTQAHHLLPKEIYPIWHLELKNGICLCAKCHRFGKLSFHKNPIWASEWLKNNRPKQYKWAVKHLGLVGEIGERT